MASHFLTLALRMSAEQSAMALWKHSPYAETQRQESLTSAFSAMHIVLVSEHFASLELSCGNQGALVRYLRMSGDPLVLSTHVLTF